MTLAWKAAWLIILNVILTFTGGLLARDLVLNPELAKVERENDRKVVHQLNVLVELIRDDALESVARIKATAARTDNDHWENFSAALSELAATSDLSYVIAASHAGDLVQVRPGLNFDYDAPPAPSEIETILATVEDAGKPYVSLLQSTQWPIIVAADSLRYRDQGPSLFVAVIRVDSNFINRISAFSGLPISLISIDEYERIKAEPRALSGIRANSNRLAWSIQGTDGNPALSLRVDLPPRSYDDRFFTPTIGIALVITLMLWAVTIWLIRHTLIRPMNAASATLGNILRDQDYGRRLEYPHHDELGKLLTHANRLLGMVDRHTAKLETLSLTDPLTGLNNRRAFDTYAARYWSVAERSGTRMALLAFDIDHFKAYNDTYGHPAGDKVIRTVADILNSIFKRASDVVTRVGGEEFLVLTQDSPEGSCLVLANRVLQELRERKIEHSANPNGMIVTVSAGVFHAVPDANLTLEIALNRVDEILYAAKDAGRNTVMQSSALINHIRRATSAEIIKLR